METRKHGQQALRRRVCRRHLRVARDESGHGGLFCREGAASLPLQQRADLQGDEQPQHEATDAPFDVQEERQCGHLPALPAMKAMLDRPFLAIQRRRLHERHVLRRAVGDVDTPAGQGQGVGQGGFVWYQLSAIGSAASPHRS